MTQQNAHIQVKRSDDNSATLTVTDLTLNRPDDGTPLIRKLNLTLKPGDRLIISGASGSGKSTLIRAMREIWDAGEGKIEIPAAARIITASQKAYMPTMSLKGVLSYPASESDFYDVQIERALRAVGHDRLVQYLPERQTHYLIDRVLETIPALLKNIDAAHPQQKKVEALSDAVLATIPDIVKGNIDTAQPLSYQNERHLRQGLIDHLDAAFGHSVQRHQTEYLATRISDKLNQSLVQKLVNHLVADVPSLLDRYLGKIEYIDAHRLGYFTEKLTDTIQQKMTPTLEKARVLGLNDTQIRYIAEQIERAVDRHLTPHQTSHYTVNKIGGWIGKIFNGAAAPLRQRDWFGMGETGTVRKLMSVFANAASADVDLSVHLLRKPLLNWAIRKTSGFLLDSAALFMAREVINGDILSKRLSGGEQQRLVFARALLHQPDILILDEVTAALDREAGVELYAEIIKKLPQTTIISVAHNMHLLPYHTLHAHLQDREMTVTPIQQAPQP